VAYAKLKGRNIGLGWWSLGREAITTTFFTYPGALWLAIAPAAGAIARIIKKTW